MVKRYPLNKKQKLINVTGALLIFVLAPVFIIFTTDFSKPMSTVAFMLNIIIRFLIVYFVIAIPVHFLIKKCK